MTQFTQKAILQTFTELLRELPFDKITVSALVKRCGISPNTFYYHYRDIYDLLDAWLKTTSARYVEKNLSWQDTIRAFLTDCKKNPRLVYHLFESRSRDQLEQTVFSLCGQIFEHYVTRRVGNLDIPEDRLHEIADYCRNSFLGFFLHFLWKRMDTDVDKAVERLAELTIPFVAEALEKYNRTADSF